MPNYDYKSLDQLLKDIVLLCQESLSQLCHIVWLVILASDLLVQHF